MPSTALRKGSREDAAAIVEYLRGDLDLREGEAVTGRDQCDGGRSPRVRSSYISPITAWEIGLLTLHGRLQLLIRPERWFANLFDAPGVELAELTPDVLIASSYLPGRPPKDPHDRIIAATARELGATLITRTRALLAYAGARAHRRRGVLKAVMVIGPSASA